MCFVRRAGSKEKDMPKEIFPSSYLCDCGHQSDFLENTVREVKAMSHRRRIYLEDSEPDEHTIVFYKGEMVEVICPLQDLAQEATSEWVKKISSRTFWERALCNRRGHV